MVLEGQREAALAALEWQIELGATEAICDAPVNRMDAAEKPARAAPETAQAVGREPAPEPEQAANAAAPVAAAAYTLAELRAAMEAFEGCELKKGAKNTVFADGNPEAVVMIVGEAPGRDEDLAGRPFVGRSGQLLDRMLAAIGLSRGHEDPARAVYITNVLPWRPPQNRDPSSDEIEMLRTFLLRHIELKSPDILVTMGNAATKSILGNATGITRMRGKWAAHGEVPVLPMFHPAALLRNPAQKREAWADLLSLQARMRALD